MNKTTITKTLNKIESLNNDKQNYSLGFCRLFSLPTRVRRNFDLAAYLNGESHENQKTFLSELTEQEFINWMKLQ